MYLPSSDNEEENALLLTLPANDGRRGDALLNCWGADSSAGASSFGKLCAIAYYMEDPGMVSSAAGGTGAAFEFLYFRPRARSADNKCLMRTLQNCRAWAPCIMITDMLRLRRPHGLLHPLKDCKQPVSQRLPSRGISHRLPLRRYCQASSQRSPMSHLEMAKVTRQTGSLCKS